MAILAAVFVARAAVLHVYIFLMESVWWTRPRPGSASVSPDSRCEHYPPDGVQPGLLESVPRPRRSDRPRDLLRQPAASRPGDGAVYDGSNGARGYRLTTTGRGDLRPALVQHSSRVRCRSSDSCCSCSPELKSSGPRIAPVGPRGAPLCPRRMFGRAPRAHRCAASHWVSNCRDYSLSDAIRSIACRVLRMTRAKSSSTRSMTTA